MATRINPDELKEIIETELEDPSLLSFIIPANQLVTEHLGGVTSMSDDRKKEIERWLAAHFLTCREQQIQSERVGPEGEAQATYQGKTGMGLDATFYGQNVKLLDTTGILAAELGKKKVVIYAATSFVGKG